MSSLILYCHVQDVLVVSGDLVLQQADQLRRLVDLHRLHNSAFTALLSKPAFQPTGMTVPGAKATKEPIVISTQQ